jgi:hypothetical protein
VRLSNVFVSYFTIEGAYSQIRGSLKKIVGR